MNFAQAATKQWLCGHSSKVAASARVQCTVCHARIMESEMVVQEYGRRWAFCGVCGLEREVIPVDDLEVTINLDTPAERKPRDPR